MVRIVAFGRFDSHSGRLGSLRQMALQESSCSLITTKSARRRATITIGLKVGEETMADSVYKVIEVIGTSTESWEKAAANAVERASKTLRDLRVAEIAQLDMQVSNGKVEAYRAKVKVSFKFED
jgi:flavin-binding protein dodecin